MAPTKGTKPAAPSRKSKSKLSTLTLDSFSAGPKRAPSTSLSAPPSLIQKPKLSKPLSSLVKSIPKGSEVVTSHLSKGKESATLARENELWVDKYTPETEAELAVHKKKVEDIRRWLAEAFDGGPTGILKKYRRILALTGPAGTGKTAVLRVLERELDFGIVEWGNTLDDNFSTDGYDFDHESLMKKFTTFFERASMTPAFSLFPPSPPAGTMPSMSPPMADSMLPPSSPPRSSIPPSSSPPTGLTPTIHQRQIILLEDIPNVLHPSTASAFHDALEEFLSSSSEAPLVLVVSDAGTRGEDLESDMGWSRRWGKQAIDIRSIVPSTIFNSPYFTEIQFNPIAPTLLVKALNNLLTRHFSSTSKTRGSMQQPSKEVLQIIVESAHGDIRSAIMALQFACIVQLPKSKKKGGPRVVLEVMTRREQSLALFHMLGKVFYNKRKGDPQNPSATTKTREREAELDEQIPDPPDLPPHLEEHTRRSSRVNVNTLYADSPIDTSLFALYLHHNYTQFCNEIEECEAVCERMSWIDASAGEMWQTQRNPHQFHILTLGTLHGLPSPVPRRSQKIFKPEFFDILKKHRAAEDSVIDTEAWLNERVEAGSRRWGRNEVVLELGGVLKALDECGTARAPPAHSLFTKLSFVHPARMPGNTQRMQQLGEGEAPVEIISNSPGSPRDWKRQDEEPTGGWLENDDIQDF